MIGHAVELGVLDRHLAIVRFGHATVEALGKAFDGGMNILRQSLDRLASAGVADIQRREAGGLECRLHFFK